MSVNALTQEIRKVKTASPSNKPTLGNYDPMDALQEKSAILEHEFVDWNDTRMLARRVLEITESGNIPVITLEPNEEGVDGEILLRNIANGEYDEKLAQIRNIVTASSSRVYLRFAHEMDLANLYPWGAKDPLTYIAAYRHTVSFMSRRPSAQNLIWIWSPAGNSGADKYYPGDDVVDIVGTTILYDKYWYDDTYVPFTELAGKRLWLKQFNKPLWIAEFGVGASTAELQEKIITESLYQYDGMGYEAILYLNIRDSNISGPDYRLHKQNIDLLEF